MAVLAGFFTDYQQKLWMDALFSGDLYLGLLTGVVGRISTAEVAATQTLGGFTDFAVDGAVATRITSASHPFAAADTSVVVSGGVGWTPGTYTIGSLTGTAANLNTSPAAVGTAGGTGSIVRSTGYVRTLLAAGIFDAASGGRTSNNALVTLPAPTGDWGTVRAFGIYDAATAGNLLAVLSAAEATAIAAGDAARTVAAGALKVSRT